MHGRDLTGTEESCHKVNLLLNSEAGTALNSICPCQFDYIDRSCDPDILLPSLDDRRAEKIMNESCILVDGHYQIGIPWKKNCPHLPNNYSMALSRLRSLGKRLVADPELFDRYKGKIRDMISQGHAIEVLDQSEKDQSKVWYIPHHCVTEKFRVVFDCAGQFKGTSLNQQILQGPDNTNNLVGVLTRFRKHPVAVVGDVRAMFMQVKVDPLDQSALRFLWWTDDDPTKDPKEYQLTVHCFGLTSSPSVAGFALRRTAEDNRSQLEDEVRQVVYKNIYVDDLLVSTPDEDTAKTLIKGLVSLLKEGGFELAKFSSNNVSVLEALPNDCLTPALTEVDFRVEELPDHQALGLVWEPQGDYLRIKVAMLSYPSTRRGLLSLVMSLFDPLGVVSPFLLPLKLQLQRLSKLGLGWDAQIPEEERVVWERLMKGFSKLSQICVPRTFQGLTNSAENQLHVFADASNSGIGAICYLRTRINNTHFISFVMGKSRVAPIKPMSTPRMELSAAVIAVRLAKFVQRELDLYLMETVFWSDSTTVLSYLRNTSKRRPIFETNRINLIREFSSVNQWRWVDTANNPADLYSRGVAPLQVYKSEKWLKGPTFLLDPECTWPAKKSFVEQALDEDASELPPISEINLCVNSSRVVSLKEGAIGRLITRFSELSRAVRVAAWLLRLKSELRRRVEGGSRRPISDVIDAREYDVALLSLIALVQRQEFPGLVEVLASHTYYELAAGERGTEQQGQLKPMLKCCPFVENGLLRVGGRLQRSSEPHDVKHPIILPKNSHLTGLIIMHVHQRSGHCGATYVTNELRQRYWVLGHERTVKHFIKELCMACRNRRASPGSQIMSPLPSARVESDRRLFTATGVDFMGPIAVKCRRNVLKRYCCLFTCLASRASHIEVAGDLTTGSFLMALRRFLATRGASTETIYCDNATNFVGARTELQRGLERLKRKEIMNELAPRGIEFRHSPPLASHQGGVWEAIIRLVRKALNAVMTDRYYRNPTDEELLTFLKEVELILNCRPLTRFSPDPEDWRALTPMTLLNGCKNAALPMGVFANSDGLRASYRATQRQADLFWQRWRSEYLSMLQRRHKWLVPRANIKPNTLVLLCDDAAPRGHWSKAIVTSVIYDRDKVCRRVVVRTPNGKECVRDIRKICVLECDV